MDRRTKQKSCFPCVEGKRRCDRTVPFCTRCVDRGVDCVYPRVVQRRLGQSAPNGSERTNMAASYDGGFAASAALVAHEQVDTDHHMERDGAVFMISPPHGASPIPDTDNDTTRSPGPAGNSLSYGSSTSPATVPSGAGTDTLGTNRSPSVEEDLKWFTHPSTWMIAYHYQPPASLPSPQVFSDFIRGLQSWLSRFQREGHCPLIHRHLYPARAIPDCIQDAYAAIAVSEGTCPENENMVDSIANSFVTRLLSAQAQLPGQALQLVTTSDHLARTQALLIHLILALFSPSISRQAKAEGFIETLHRWKLALWESASQEASLVEMFPSMHTGPLEGGGPDAESIPDRHRAFIICESIRRTWLLCSMTIGVYRSLRGDWSSACGGDVRFTARAGLWDAPSSARWAAVARKADPLFDYSLLGHELAKRDVSAAELDEFAHHLFMLMWGSDKVDSWFVRT